MGRGKAFNSLSKEDNMRARAYLEFDFPDEKAAKAALAGLSHEKDIGSRSRTQTRHADKKIGINIESEDVVALRAAANACLRAMQVFEQIEKD